MTGFHTENNRTLGAKKTTSVMVGLSHMATPSNQPPTCTVLGTDGVAVETWRADVAVRTGCVVHAVQTLAGQRMTVGEQHVGVSVAMAITRLTLAAQHHGVAIITRGTPASTRKMNTIIQDMSCLHFD